MTPLQKDIRKSMRKIRRDLFRVGDLYRTACGRDGLIAKASEAELDLLELIKAEMEKHSEYYK